MASPAVVRSRVLTLPNVISLARLGCVPIFLWLLFGRDNPVGAAWLLAALGASDWVDGWIARHFNQGSELGKVLDPTADRVLLLAAVVALLVDGSVPLWLGVLVLARELVISVAVLVLAAAGAARIDVQWAGKAGTLALMFGLPAFLLADHLSDGAGRTFMFAFAWIFSVSGLLLSYYATIEYVPLARKALKNGRLERTTA
jgi:cardiolipin synthase (CMP-forming)